MSVGAGIALGVGGLAVAGLVGYLVWQQQKNKPTKSQLLGGAIVDLAGDAWEYFT